MALTNHATSLSDVDQDCVWSRGPSGPARSARQCSDGFGPVYSSSLLRKRGTRGTTGPAPVRRGLSALGTRDHTRTAQQIARGPRDPHCEPPHCAAATLCGPESGTGPPRGPAMAVSAALLRKSPSGRRPAVLTTRILCVIITM